MRSRGPLASITRLGLRRMYQRMLDAEVADVARMAANPYESDPGERSPTRVSLPERVWHGLGKAMRGGRERQAP